MSHIFGNALGLPGVATILLMGLPQQRGWHCYRASLAGEEAACGSMLVDEKVALMGLDATTAAAMGHGCESALITRRLADAARAGCDLAVAEVVEGLPMSETAITNRQRLGFVEIPGLANWRRPAGVA